MSNELTAKMLNYYAQAGAYVRYLYNAGLEYEPWSTERAELHHRSLLYFVEEFIQPPLSIPEFHKEWYWWMVSEPSYINMTAREHGKSETHSIFRPTWELCCDPTLRFVLAAKKQAIASDSLGAIKNYLGLPRIIAGFGQLNPAKLPTEERLTDALDWGKDTITLNRDERARTVRGPSIVTVGAMSSVLSIRAERLIADDVVDALIAESDAQCERMLTWYDGDLLPVLVPQREGGQELVVGTPYNSRDLYAHKQQLVAEQDEPLYKIFRGDAILDERNQKTLWEEKWPYSELMHQRAKMGTIRFNRNYRCMIMSDEDSSFPTIWFKGGEGLDGTHYVGCFDSSIKLRPQLRDKARRVRFSNIVIGIDPALGKTARSAFFVAIVLGINADGHIQMLDAYREKIGFKRQRDLVIKLWERWGGTAVKAVVVENNAYQGALIEGVREKNFRIPIVTKTTTGKDPIHIPTMDVWFESGRVRLPTGDAKGRAMSEQLATEMNLWPNAATSDMLMALFFAHTRLVRYSPALTALLNPENLAFGDTQRMLDRQVMSPSGILLPGRTLRRVQELAKGAPFTSSREGLHSTGFTRPDVAPTGIPEEW